VPTLVIHGDDDRIVPLGAAGQRTAKLIKRARLQVGRGGPPCITWTHAEEMNAELLSFLGEKALKSKREVAYADWTYNRDSVGRLRLGSSLFGHDALEL
jgi:hypothetical protein